MRASIILIGLGLMLGLPKRLMRFLVLVVLAVLGLALAPDSARAQLNLDNISIAVTEVNPANIFRFRLDAEGAEISDAEVTPPVGPPIPLPCVGPPTARDCSYVEEFPSLMALEAKFPDGTYLFEFNAGSSSKLLEHELPPLPLEFVDIDISPDHEGGNTSTTPTFSWLCPASCLAATKLDIEMEDPNGEVFSASYIPPSGGSITLPDGPFIPLPTDLEGAFGSLTLGVQYTLWSSIENLVVMLETLGASDDFEYSDESKRERVYEFTATTPPIPALPRPALIVLALLLVASSAYIQSRRCNPT